MNYSEMVRLMSAVGEEFATVLGIDPAAFAGKAANEVPADYRGNAVGELRRACELTERKMDGGLHLDRPGMYALKVFIGGLRDKAAKAAAPSASADPFVQETIREIEEADAEIRRMPQSRHDRVAAIERWRNERFTSRETPAPLWALYGFADERSYVESSERLKARQRAERGLGKPMPKGTQTLAGVIQHSQTLRDLDAANNEDDE